MFKQKQALPVSLSSPANPIIIQGRINPCKTYENCTVADYVAPPFSLVFTNANKPTNKDAVDTILSLKRRRTENVLDVFTNAFRIADRARSNAHVRCVGVAYDGILSGECARRHPDSRGRMGIIVSGLVPIVCNPDDVKSLSIGDDISWRFRDNGIQYNGCPPDWSTVQLRKYIPGHSFLEIDDSFDQIFGGIEPYDTSKKSELQNRLYFIDHKRKGSIADYFSIDGVSPEELVEAVALIVMKTLDIDLSRGWQDVLYNPDSQFFIMETRPSPGSMKWIEDCFGELAPPLYVAIDNSGKISIEKDSSADNYFIPQSSGWFAEFIHVTGKTDIYTEYKTQKPMKEFKPPPPPTEYIQGLFGHSYQRKMEWIEYAKQDFLNKNKAARDNSAKISYVRFYRQLALTKFDFRNIDKATAKNITSAIERMTVNPSTYGTWLDAKKKAIINHRVYHENKIGTLVNKAEDHITVLLDTH